MGVSQKLVRQCLSVLRRNFQLLLRLVNKVGSAQHISPGPADRAEDEAPDVGDEALKTRITDHDREHLRTFPLHRKAQVMKKIRSLAPTQSVVCHGNNQFEKAMLKMHRDGYQLIDMQSQETAFTTVWYRKGHSFSGGTEVTMLLWEDGGNSDSTTMMSWKI